MKHDSCTPLKNGDNQVWEPTNVSFYGWCTLPGGCAMYEDFPVARAFVNSEYKPAKNVAGEGCKYPKNSLKGDIAVLELEKDIDFDKYSIEVAPACVNTEEPKIGSILGLFGYGNAAGDTDHGYLRKHFSRVTGKDRRYKDYINTEHPEARSCSGDSGSGRIVFIDGRAHLASVHSSSASSGHGCPLRVNRENQRENSIIMSLNHEWICHATGVCPIPLDPATVKQLKDYYWVFENQGINDIRINI